MSNIDIYLIYFSYPVFRKNKFVTCLILHKNVTFDSYICCIDISTHVPKCSV